MTDQVDRLTSALADRYTIERELGAGGMATVYLAQDRKLGRAVALQVLRPEALTRRWPEWRVAWNEFGEKLTYGGAMDPKPPWRAQWDSVRTELAAVKERR